MPHETTWEAHGICQKFRGTLSSPELLAALGENPELVRLAAEIEAKLIMIVDETR